ncbi:MAG: S8 family peptidase [Candidatus Eremiobacteraeota bacterium]|nr:S8 family peptidase [Candidatus Eremiobacteraeota bacterium]
MTAPVGKSGPEYFSYQQMVDLNKVMESPGYKGPKAEEAAPRASQPSDTLDVIIISKPTKSGSKGSARTLGKNLVEKGVTVEDQLKTIGGVSAKVKPEQMEQLKQEGYIVYDNSPRTLVPGIPKVRLEGNNWDMPKIDPVTMTGADKLQEKGFDGTGKTVAVVDSGFENPKFELKAWKDMAGESSVPDDAVGHGTHVAGCVNQMAPEAEIVAVRVMGPDGTGKPSDIVKGIEWVINNKEKLNIDVMNLSLGAGPDGYPYYYDPINMAVEEAIDKGITVVSAAGNSGPEPQTIGGPADDPKGITVGAGLNAKKVSDFSSRGPTDDGFEKPDIVAPGEYIVSWMVPDSQMGKTAQIVQTLRNMSIDQLTELLMKKPELIEAFGLPENILEYPDKEREKMIKTSLPPMFVTDKEHMAAPGTSFAAPLVSGIAADLKEANPRLSPEDIKSVLMETADSMGSQYGVYDQGKGFVDAKEAMDKATGKG